MVSPLGPAMTPGAVWGHNSRIRVEADQSPTCQVPRNQWYQITAVIVVLGLNWPRSQECFYPRHDLVGGVTNYASPGREAESQQGHPLSLHGGCPLKQKQTETEIYICITTHFPYNFASHCIQFSHKCSIAKYYVIRNLCICHTKPENGYNFVTNTQQENMYI